MSVFVIIPAAGSGVRFGGNVPKQFLDWKGKSILEHTVDAFLKFKEVKKVVVCLPEGTKSSFESDRVQTVTGASTRAQSVHAGFKSLDVKPTDSILIHDAVRPLLSSKLMETVLDALKKDEGVIPILSVSDTVKEISEGFILRTIPRENLGLAQTPQGFKASVLQKAYAQNLHVQEGMTDEAKMAEALGVRVACIPGEPTNIKITVPEDLRWLE